MSGIFKKAMGLFVEFEDEPAQSQKSDTPAPSKPSASQALKADEVDKFEKHFEKIFDEANFPGPDYYEFWKMSETLAAHIPDERARFSATFASLTIQGLTKEKLIETASKYRELVDQDKLTFMKLASDKGEKEIGAKRKDVDALNEKIKKNSELIQKLTKEITESQIAIERLKAVVSDEENKLARNKQGYNLASEAMIKKITEDITKIQTLL